MRAWDLALRPLAIFHNARRLADRADDARFTKKGLIQSPMFVIATKMVSLLKRTKKLLKLIPILDTKEVPPPRLHGN